MKILVLGGSYFYGKAFVKMAAGKHAITVFNRGTVSMEEYGVSQITGDRHDADVIRSVEGDFDVIVDFCGYHKGDIGMMISNLKKLPKQYIFISTVDVYKRGIEGYKTEETEYENRLGTITGGDGQADGMSTADEAGQREGISTADEAGQREGIPTADEAGQKEGMPTSGEAAQTDAASISGVAQVAAYITGKIQLEKELKELADKCSFVYTILRPAILYGEGNYAGREDLIIRFMKEAHILPMVVGAEGSFQMLYVEDAANAICRCLGNEIAFNQSYNLCGDETVTYDIFYEALKNSIKAEYKEIRMNVESAIEQGAPTPFPLTKEETELYSNEKSKCELELVYTSLTEGLGRMG